MDDIECRKHDPRKDYILSAVGRFSEYTRRQPQWWALLKPT